MPTAKKRKTHWSGKVLGAVFTHRVEFDRSKYQQDHVDLKLVRSIHPGFVECREPGCTRKAFGTQNTDSEYHATKHCRAEHAPLQKQKAQQMRLTFSTTPSAECVLKAVVADLVLYSLTTVDEYVEWRKTGTNLSGFGPDSWVTKVLDACSARRCKHDLRLLNHLLDELKRVAKVIKDKDGVSRSHQLENVRRFSVDSIKEAQGCNVGSDVIAWMQVWGTDPAPLRCPVSAEPTISNPMSVINNAQGEIVVETGDWLSKLQRAMPKLKNRSGFAVGTYLSSQNRSCSTIL